MTALISRPGALRTGGLLLAALLPALPLSAQQPAVRDNLPELKSARVVERGSHHAKWETVQEVADPISGETISVTNSYTQLETGLHYQDERGEWQASSEEIEVQPGAAVARRGPHQVRWAANLNTQGAIEFWTPEGEAIRSHVLGLAYFDPATGAHVMIGEVQDSVGAVAGNQVIYEDAFDGVSADLHYTYTKSGFVQDVIVREQLPDPALWGFDPATVQVQVLTEFVALPDELKELARITAEASAATNALTGSFEAAYAEDQALNFGSMTMTQGRAFGVADEAQERAVPVRKRLQLFEGGRNLLLETLDFSVIEPELETLPENSKPTASLDRKSSGQQTAGLRVAPPAPTRQWAAVEPQANEDKEPLLMARAELPAGRNGYVIDYNLSGSTNNLTLQGNTTYHITGLVTATGTTTIEGGTVVKFANTNNAELRLQGTLACLTAPYRPAVFTAKDDNTVGATISGSTGTPSGYYASTAVTLDNFASHLQYVHIRHAHRAVSFNWNNAAAQTLSHAQMVKCAYGVVSLSPNFQVRNALLHQVITNFHTTGSGITGSIEHLTSRYANRLNGSGSLTLNVTNSLLVQITNSSSYNNGGGNRSTSSDAGVFQTVGAGESYLAAGSADRNSGLTNISATLRTELGSLTTHPPMVLTNLSISTGTVLSPLAARDTDIPDRGYHYAPLDYVVSDLTVTNATLILTNGVAVGVHGLNGFKLAGGGNLIGSGSPLVLNRLVRYQTVQEQANTNWSYLPGGTATSVTDSIATTGTPPQLSLRFTEFSVMSGSFHHFHGGKQSSLSEVRDSQFAGGSWFYPKNGTSALTLNFINNLCERLYFEIDPDGDQVRTVSVYNNSFINGYAGLGRHDDDGTWNVRDNLFWKTSIYQGWGFSSTHHSHNGYLSGFNRLTPNQASDKVLNSLSFQVGPLGRFYFPGSAALINGGSRTAANAGLYHHTVLAAQTKEAASQVDIGYHSVALSSVYQASAGFSGTQGTNGWYYQYGSTRGLPTAQLSIYDSGNARWTKDTVAPDMWCRVAADQQLCAWSFDSFRSFLIPTSGRVAIRGLVWDLQICGGSSIYDGAEVRILRNGTTAVDWRVFPEASLPIPIDTVVDVTAGDYLHFQLSRKTNNSCDETAWNPVISYVGGNTLSLPIDTDGDTLADYFEDANGNGTADGGETNWQSYNSPSGLGAGPAVQLYTPLRN